MSELIIIPKVRQGSDVKMTVTLTDNGVAVDWTSLSDIVAMLYSNEQRVLSGQCRVEVDPEDSTKLICNYDADNPEFVGINSLVVRCTYLDRKKTYDKKVLEFVATTDELDGQSQVIEDPELDVTINVEDVSTSLLDNAIDAAFVGGAFAMEKGQYADEKGGYAKDQGDYAKSQGDYAKNKGNYAKQKGDYALEQGGIAADAAALANQKAGLANDAATLANQKAGLANDAATLANTKAGLADDAATLANTKAGLADDAATLANTKAGLANDAATLANQKAGYASDQGDYAKAQGDYAKEKGDAFAALIVDNLTTDDATKALSAKQGKVLDGKISQLGQEMINNGVIDIVWIGAFSSASYAEMEIGDFLYDTNNPSKLYQKTGEQTRISFNLNTNGIVRYKGIDLVYSPEKTILRLHPKYTCGVIEIVAIQSYAPTLSEGQFYIYTGTAESKPALSCKLGSRTFNTLLNVNGLYRLNDKYFKFNGTNLVLLDEVESTLARNKNIIFLSAMARTSSGLNLPIYSFYLNIETGKLYQRARDESYVEIERIDGMIAYHKGVMLMYYSTSAKWIPCVPTSWKVATYNPAGVKWVANNDKVIVAEQLVTNVGTGWGCAMKQKISVGDIVIAKGGGTVATNSLFVTDTNYAIIDNQWNLAGNAPYVFVAEQNGYVFFNYNNDSGEHYLYISSYDNTIELMTIGDSNPVLYDEYTCEVGDIYYKITEDVFRIFTGVDSNNLDVSLFMRGAMSNIRLKSHGQYLLFNRFGVAGLNEPLYNLSDPTPLSPDTIAIYKQGITFDYHTLQDEIYAKFAALQADFPDFITEYDAVSLANNGGVNLAYPVYANLNGQASGDYLATPTYRTNIYKIAAQNSIPLLQGSWNRKIRIFLLGGVHPYEIAACANLYLFIKNILDNMMLDKNIFEFISNTEIYVLPTLNGYGIYHTNDGNYRTNANGVNINRNFPTFRWEQGEVGQNYGGPSAGSEFETQLVMALTNYLNPDICIDHHNYDSSARQLFATVDHANLRLVDLIYHMFYKASYELKKTYPSIFGTNFAYLNEMTNGQGIMNNHGGSSSDWWSLAKDYHNALTLEVSRCLNYHNGVIDTSTMYDDYGNTTFSVNEYELRCMIWILLNSLS